MIRGRVERLIWQLTSLTLGDDAYGQTILGDLIEGRELVARDAGEPAAARWLQREALRSWFAFLPALERRPRDLAVAVGVAGSAYAAAVNGVGPLTIRIADWCGIATGILFDLLYLALIAILGAVAGLSTFATRRGNPAGAGAFFMLAVVFGAHHLVASNSHELAFRATKVVVFIAFAAIGSALAVLAHRNPLGVSG